MTMYREIIENEFKEKLTPVLVSRCWCVNHDGSPQEQEDEARFYYSVTALMVKCSQNA